MAKLKIHPLVDDGVQPAAKNFKGGTLSCKCSEDPVTVALGGNVAFNLGMPDSAPNSW
jgi:S-(hydroxymethyl)glutathione synthase